MGSSYAADLELARQCAAGDEESWRRFMLEYRPLLYRAADALDRTGGARELADCLYADLYGLKTGDGERQSLFRYFQGRSSLATWLRAVLAQRYVDRLRAQKKMAPLPDDDAVPASAACRVQKDPAYGAGGHPDPQRPRYVSLLGRALSRAVERLSPRDRLRLGCYYVQDLTLAETGRLLKEHEATVSRQLARTRQAIRRDVEDQLRDVERLTDEQIAACFASVADDPGSIDLGPLFDKNKERAAERSI